MTDDGGKAKAFDVLNSRGLTAKRDYVRGLEQRRDPEAMSLLVECLCDESWYLRDLAEKVFLRLGAEAGPVLLPWLEQGLWYTRTSAAGILGRIGHRGAVPGLLRLADDPNRTVHEAACAALVAIARQGGATRLAWELHRLPPEARRRRIDDLATTDRALVERLERLLANGELMSHADREALVDDGALVRSHDEGVEWEVLVSPPAAVPGVHGRGGAD
jgi:HEAT repeat protein